MQPPRPPTRRTYAVTALIESTSDGRYRLNPRLITVDYWRFRTALAAQPLADSDDDRTRLAREILALYRGELAEGVSAEWVYPYRQDALRDALDTAIALARDLAPRNPEQALTILQRATTYDPYNEHPYQLLMRLQHELGQSAAAARTLHAPAAKFAELDTEPSPEAKLIASGRPAHKAATTRRPDRRRAHKPSEPQSPHAPPRTPRSNGPRHPTDR